MIIPCVKMRKRKKKWNKYRFKYPCRMSDTMKWIQDMKTDTTHNRLEWFWPLFPHIPNIKCNFYASVSRQFSSIFVFHWNWQCNISTIYFVLPQILQNFVTCLYGFVFFVFFFAILFYFSFTYIYFDCIL